MTRAEPPAPGLGTSGLADEECVETVREALDLGYRHVDTAQMYDNEREVGEGLAAADVAREEVFLATKVHPGNLAPGDVLASTETSLDRLGVDHVDLLYVHWPLGAYDAGETLPAFDELVEEGLVGHVGLSNFTPELLDEAREVLDAPVFAHQVECHPLLPQRELRAYADRHGHHLVGYSPLGQGAVLDHLVLVEVAEAHGATPAQVALAWLHERGVVPIPKARGDHLRENRAARELDLDEADLEAIDAVEERDRVVDPDGAPWDG